MSDRLEAIPEAVRQARRTLRIIRQNIYWAVGYNALALPVAATGFLTPWLAALGMSLSSLLVVGNALRLKSDLPEPPARLSGNPSVTDTGSHQNSAVSR
jgi:Cu2+-exporting ATPase